MRATVLLIILSFGNLATFSQLNGTYTIGGVTPNYTTCAAALTDLIANGVSGPVIFDVRDGTYNEQIDIPQITGASVTNSIIFQSENNDSTLVVLEFDITFWDDYVIFFDGADYVTIKSMTLKNLDNTLATVVKFDSIAI